MLTAEKPFVVNKTALLAASLTLLLLAAWAFLDEVTPLRELRFSGYLLAIMTGLLLVVNLMKIPPGETIPPARFKLRGLILGIAIWNSILWVDAALGQVTQENATVVTSYQAKGYSRGQNHPYTDVSVRLPDQLERRTQRRGWKNYRSGQALMVEVRRGPLFITVSPL